MTAGHLPGEPPNAYRLSGAMMIGSGVINAGMAAMWVLGLGFLCVGLLWIVPLAVAIGEVVVGLLAVLGVPIRFGPIAAVVGIVNGTLLFSFPAVALQIVALVFFQQEDSLRYVALPGPANEEGPPS
jgi:hypothetical protein